MKEHSRNEYIRYRINRSEELIKETELLIAHKYWNTAVNRLYYAAYYAVSALLYSQNIETNSHAGCRLKFGQEYIQKGLIGKEYGKLFSSLYEKRQKGDYNDFFDFQEDDVMQMFEPTVKLVRLISSMIRLD